MEVFQIVWNGLKGMTFTFNGITVSLLELMLFSLLFVIFLKFIVSVWK